MILPILLLMMQIGGKHCKGQNIPPPNEAKSEYVCTHGERVKVGPHTSCEDGLWNIHVDGSAEFCEHKAWMQIGVTTDQSSKTFTSMSFCDADGHCIPISEVAEKYVHEKAVNDSLEKRITDLEKRVQELENQPKINIHPTTPCPPEGCRPKPVDISSPSTDPELQMKPVTDSCRKDMNGGWELAGFPDLSFGTKDGCERFRDISPAGLELQRYTPTVWGNLSSPGYGINTLLQNKTVKTGTALRMQLPKLCGVSGHEQCVAGGRTVTLHDGDGFIHGSDWNCENTGNGPTTVCVDWKTLSEDIDKTATKKCEVTGESTVDCKETK